MGLELMQLLCRRHLSFKLLPDISAPDLPLQARGATSEADLRLQIQELRQKLALKDTRSSRNDNDIKELISLVTRIIEQLAASESQLEACKQENRRIALENAALERACSRQRNGIFKLCNLLQHREGSQVVPEAEPTTPAAADNTSEPLTPARQLFPMFVGAAEATSELEYGRTSSCAPPAETEVQGSVFAFPVLCGNNSPSTAIASPLQGSHSLADIPSRSLPQLPDTLGLGDLPLARCLSSPLNTAGSGAEDGGDSSSTPSKEQGSESNTSEPSTPTHQLFPALLGAAEPASPFLECSSSSSSSSASVGREGDDSSEYAEYLALLLSTGASVSVQESQQEEEELPMTEGEVMTRADEEHLPRILTNSEGQGSAQQQEEMSQEDLEEMLHQLELCRLFCETSTSPGTEAEDQQQQQQEGTTHSSLPESAEQPMYSTQGSPSDTEEVASPFEHKALHPQPGIYYERSLLAILEGRSLTAALETVVAGPKARRIPPIAQPTRMVRNLGSVAGSPLQQRSHSLADTPSRSLPQLPETLGLGDLPLAHCLSSPLDTAGSGAEDGGDSSVTNTLSSQQGSESNTSELAMPARRWFPVLLEPDSVDRSSSGSSTCASPSPAGAQGTATSSPLQRSHSVTHSFTHSLPQLPGTLGLGDLPFTRRLSSPLLGSAGSGAECGDDSSITNTPSKQQGSGCSAESSPQSSESCSTSSPAFAATDMSSSGLGAYIAQVSIANHRLSMSCIDAEYMVKHEPAMLTHNPACVKPNMPAHNNLHCLHVYRSPKRRTHHS
jgi:hypothetical protein